MPGTNVAGDDSRPGSSASALENDLFDMANLYPRTTGLPMTVWVSPRGLARHDVRVKANLTHGDRMDAGNTAVIGVRPSPRVIAGQLSPSDERAISDWITLNEAVIVAYWNGAIDTVELAARLKRVP